MRRLYSTLALLGFGMIAHSQTLDKSVGDQPWRIISSVNGFSPETSNQSYVIYEVPKGESGILMLNSAGQIKWNTRLKEKPFQVARIDNFIAVIGGLEPAVRGERDYCFAFLVDPSNGKLITEKKIPIKNKGFYVFPKVYRSTDGRFLKLGLRYSKRSSGGKNVFMYGVGANAAFREMRSIGSMEILSLNKDLDVANTATLKIAPGELVQAGSDMDINGSVVCAGFDLEALTITLQRFPDGRNEADQQIRFASGAKSKEEIRNAFVYASELQPNTAFFCYTCVNEDKDHQLEIDKLDFSNGSRISTRDILEKPYRKELEGQPTVKFPGVRSSPEFDRIEDMHASKILDLGNTVLICKTIDGSFLTMENNTMMVNQSSVLTAYDGSLKKRYERVIPHEYKSYRPTGLGVDLLVRDKTAYFITNDSNKSTTKYDLLFGKIDISNGNIISLEHLDREDISRGHPADIATAIWFQDRFVINYMQITSIFSDNYTVTPNVYKY